MRRDNAVYLQHLVAAIEAVMGYIEGMSEKEFRNSNLVQDAVIRQLQVIGEATKRLTPEMRDRYEEIPWQRMAAMRDKLVHDYFGVDIGAVWLVATIDLPALKAQIRRVLDETMGN